MSDFDERDQPTAAAIVKQRLEQRGTDLASDQVADSADQHGEVSAASATEDGGATSELRLLAESTTLWDVSGIPMKRSEFERSRSLRETDPKPLSDQEWINLCKAADETRERKAREAAERWEAELRARTGYVDFTSDSFWSPPPPRVFVPGLVLETQVVTIYSEGGKGKSLLSLDFAVGLSVRGSIFGEPVAPATVLYIDRENSRRSLSRRVQEMGVSPSEAAVIASRLHYSLLGAIPALDTGEGGAWLKAEVARTGAKFVIIDTMSKIVEGDENANPTWQGLHNNSMVQLKAAGVTVLQLDHTGKDASKGQRGATAKRDNADAVWHLESVSGGLFRLRCEKDRDGDFGDVGACVYIVRDTVPNLHHRLATEGEIRAAGIDAMCAEQGAALQKIRKLINEGDGSAGKSEALKAIGGDNGRTRAVVNTLLFEGTIQEFKEGRKVYLRLPPTSPTEPDTSTP
jgi:hypothetical protein